MNGIRVAIVGAVSLVMASTAGPYAAASTKRVAYFDSGPTQPFIAAMTKAFMDRAKELGLDVTVFDTPTDAAIQSQQVDDAIARRFDLLAILPASEKALVPVLTRAKQAGIPVIIVNNDPRATLEGLYVSFVGEDSYQLGQLTGESVLKALKDNGRDGGKVALITGQLSEGVAQRRVASFKEAIKANPKVEIVAIEDAYWDTAKSEQIAGQLFARFAPQGGIDVLYGMADNQAVAAIRAAEAAGVQLGAEKGKLLVVGSNCAREGIEAIKAGKEYSTGIQIPARTGKRAAEMVADYLDGKTLPKSVFLPVDTVTKDNLDKWADACTY